MNILREKYGEQVDEEDEQAIEEFFEPFASERELSPERINLLINELMSDFGFDEKDYFEADSSSNEVPNVSFE